MRHFRLLATFLVTLSAVSVQGQDLPTYSFHRSVSAFTEYSNSSSHIILGVSRERHLLGFGLTLSQRLLHTRIIDWNYAPEILPLVFIEDPVANQTLTVNNTSASQSIPTSASCTPAVYTMPSDPAYGFPGYTFTQTCSTRWTYAGGASPLGQRINFAPRTRLQPFVIGNAGFLVSPRDIPVNDSSRFNFTFEFGGGIEFFRDHHRSWSAEYRIHHLSNAYTGNYNPGVDSQIIKLTYSLSR